MKIALMSDTHDHLVNIRKALEIIRQEECEAIIHCGDIVAPFALKELEHAKIPVHAVFGNNDGDHFLLCQTAAASNGLITIYGQLARIELGGARIAFTHEGPFAEGLAATGKYDMVFFGHTHQHYHDKLGDTILFNPGDVMGKDMDPGFSIVDTTNRDITRITIR